MADADYVRLLDESIRNLFRDALRISVRNPKMAIFLCRTLFHQRRAARTRRIWEEKGLHVPPFMIASITHRCNLQCSGCYARAPQMAG
jgi:uncharacterized radical SAM superfamily Fe-S cluster-containing enzyme